MPSYSFQKLFAPFAVCILAVAFVLANFLAQTPQPSPSSSPSPSPSPSPTASPARAPSPTPLPGAQNFHQWGSVTVFNGLPSDSVRAIAQTPDGVMWFGTDNGLARFDGRHVQTFSPGGPDSNGVLTLSVIESGELWIGTRAGAFVYTDNRFQPVAGTQDYGITKFLDVGEELILGTDAGLVLKCGRDDAGALIAQSAFRDPMEASDGSVVSITGLILYDGRIIASTSGRGLFELFDDLVEPPIKSRMPLVHAIAQASDKSVWLGTAAPKGASGVYLANGSTPPVKIAAPTADVFALETNDSGLWAGTERYGLFHFADGKLKKKYTFENTSGGLRSNTIFTIFTDREGVLWIGTNRGVSRFDRLGASQQAVSDIPNSNFVRTLWRNGRDLYAGSNRGFFEFGYEDEAWKKVAALGDRVIYDIGVSSQGIVVGTPSGVFDYRGRLIAGGDARSVESFGNKAYAAVVGRGVVDISSPGQEVVFPDDTASALLATPDRLWIGTGGHGLFSFDGKTTKPEFGPELLKAGAIWNMSPDLDGSILIAGQHGVFRIANGHVERVIEAEDVRDVYVDRSDSWVETPAEIWAATTTHGLLHARHHELFGWVVSSIGFEQGLPSEKAFSIAPLQGAVQYEEFTRLKMPEGLLVGTNRGVVAYWPGKVAPKLIPIRILSQRVHDIAEAKSKMDLEYPQNSLLVEVAGQSSRTFPEEFQYAFILKNGKGEEVARQLSNDAQYSPTDLVPGDYTIESIAFNRDLLASEPLTIRFSVAKAPFPWTATALGVLLVMALVGLIWAIIEHRRMTQRNRELAAARLDLANEAERERRRIARDLHDQTLADLRNLMITSDKLPIDNREFRNEIEAVSTEIRRICEDLSPSVLENVGLVAALEFLLDRTVDNRSFTADESVEDRITFPLNVQLQIYRIAQEVLTNIVRHSTATEVEMNVEAPAAGDLRLTIRDNGETFHPDGKQKGRGIANIRSRANLINGKATWKESRRGGNVFSLKVGTRNGNG
ncbi:MAG TPA: two-component regulator propeller domain-containing protein [Pyrinomonadaceae bacterium]|nr:two-component regulator propeller domain-containing protein [Pyrinomonadaceae bacterium]